MGPDVTLAFDLASGGHWYGHGFSHTQPYPLESGSIANASFAVNNIQSPIWMCSAGCAIFAETTAPLDVRINENGDGKLSIRCPGEPLNIRVVCSRTLPRARARLMKDLGWPNPPPADAMFATACSARGPSIRAASRRIAYWTWHGRSGRMSTRVPR